MRASSRATAQLPQSWYHFQTKDRDEPRPRGGLIRVREFIMKDSYSFDRDEEGLERSFRAHEGAYHRDLRPLRDRVLRRPGRVGDDGRKRVGRLPRAVGLGREHARRAARTAISPPTSKWRASLPRAPVFPAPLAAPEEVETPGRHDAARRWRDFLGIDVAATSKAMPMTTRGRRRRARARARRRPARGRQARRGARRERRGPRPRTRSGRPSAPSRARSARSASRARSSLDETLREGQFVAGANRTGWHLRGVEHGRDFTRTLRRSPRSQGGRHAASTAAARSDSRPRSRSATSSSSARVLGAARGDLPRRGRDRAAAR